MRRSLIHGKEEDYFALCRIFSIFAFEPFGYRAKNPAFGRVFRVSVLPAPASNLSHEARHIYCDNRPFVELLKVDNSEPFP